MKRRTLTGIIKKFDKTGKITQQDFLTLHSVKDRINFILQFIEAECKGEAHSNAFIDNCMVCAPLWGKVLKEEFREKEEKDNG